MKKLTLLWVVTAAFCLGKANAQTEKGTYLLGGNATFQTADGYSIFLVNPSGGYFFKDNFAAGANIYLLFADGVNSYSVGPFARYYFGKNPTGKFFGNVGLGIGKSTGPDLNLSYGLGAGYAIFLNKSIALEASANYRREIDYGGLLGINIGFQIHLKK